MLNKTGIRFYINGPPPIAKTEDYFSGLNLLNYQLSPSANGIDHSQDLNKFDSLTTSTQRNLLTLRSIKLLDFFQDKLIIDENKVSFIYNGAFGVKSIHSVLIENITYVEAHTSLISGCLVVIDSSNYRHPIELKIENIRKDAAVRARKLIQGLINAKILKMDLSLLDPYDLENYMEKLGRVVGED